jgi:hypothetical protein
MTILDTVVYPVNEYVHCKPIELCNGDNMFSSANQWRMSHWIFSTEYRCGGEWVAAIRYLELHCCFCLACALTVDSLYTIFFSLSCTYIFLLYFLVSLIMSLPGIIFCICCLTHGNYFMVDKKHYCKICRPPVILVQVIICRLWWEPWLSFSRVLLICCLQTSLFTFKLHVTHLTSVRFTKLWFLQH